MSEKKEFKIEKITDVLELNDKQFDEFLKDFVMWRHLAKTVNESGLVKQTHMIWFDDGINECQKNNH